MTKRKERLLNSLLLVDDDKDSLELYCHLLRERTTCQIVSTRYPSEALKIATLRFFDAVIIDVTMNYNGTPFGGLELYGKLLGRYGDRSLIAYSQFITDDLLKQYECNFNFIERGTNPIGFIDGLVSFLHSLRHQQSCFVAMPFDRRYNNIYAAIKECVGRARYRCIRIDYEDFTASIIERMFREIRNAKCVVFVATDRNPNAFYECGYAVALQKELVTLTDDYSNLPFDIRDRNAIAYGMDLSKLKTKLAMRLMNLTKPL